VTFDDDANGGDEGEGVVGGLDDDGDEATGDEGGVVGDDAAGNVTFDDDANGGNEGEDVVGGLDDDDDEATGDEGGVVGDVTYGSVSGKLYISSKIVSGGKVERYSFHSIDGVYIASISISNEDWGGIPTAAVIMKMHVMKKFRQQGIGRAFLLGLRWMKHQMAFKVRNPSGSAVAFYKKVGFGASSTLPKNLAHGALFIDALTPSTQKPGPGDGGRPARNGAGFRKQTSATEQTSAPGGGRGRSAENGVGLTKPTEPKASEPVLEVQIRLAEDNAAAARKRLKKVEIQVKKALKRARDKVDTADAEVERLKSTADAEVERLKSTADEQRNFPVSDDSLNNEEEEDKERDVDDSDDGLSSDLDDNGDGSDDNGDYEHRDDESNEEEEEEEENDDYFGKRKRAGDDAEVERLKSTADAEVEGLKSTADKEVRDPKRRK
jgi:GNAT superfamily N-acetyltransferase